jgi:hypothetical protein
MIIIWTRNLIVKGKKLFTGLNSTKVALWLKKCTQMAQKRAAHDGLPFWSSPGVLASCPRVHLFSQVLCGLLLRRSCEES